MRRALEKYCRGKNCTFTNICTTHTHITGDVFLKKETNIHEKQFRDRRNFACCLTHKNSSRTLVQICIVFSLSISAKIFFLPLFNSYSQRNEMTRFLWVLCDWERVQNRRRLEFHGVSVIYPPFHITHQKHRNLYQKKNWLSRMDSFFHSWFDFLWAHTEC